MERKTPSTFRHVWAAPTLIAVLSLAGLVTALLGDGIEDWIGWGGLALPLAAIVWSQLRRRS